MSQKRFYIKGVRGRVSETRFIEHMAKESRLPKTVIKEKISETEGNLNSAFIDAKGIRTKAYKKNVVKSRRVHDEKGRFSTVSKEVKKLANKLNISEDEAYFVYTESLRNEKAKLKKKFTWKGFNTTVEKMGKKFAELSKNYSFLLSHDKIAEFANERKDYDFFINGKKYGYIEFIEEMNELITSLNSFFSLDFNIEVKEKNVYINVDFSEFQEKEKGYLATINGHVIIYSS